MLGEFSRSSLPSSLADELDVVRRWRGRPRPPPGEPVTIALEKKFWG